jgi:hypothetical protein
MPEPALHSMLLKSPNYVQAEEMSRGLVRAVVAYVQLRHALNPILRPSGYFGYNPNFCEIQYAGREDPSLTVSLFGTHLEHEEAGLGAILAPPQKGYARARIHDFAELPLLLRGLDVAWQLRARRPSR